MGPTANTELLNFRYVLETGKMHAVRLAWAMSSEMLGVARRSVW